MGSRHPLIHVLGFLAIGPVCVWEGGGIPICHYTLIFDHCCCPNPPPQLKEQIVKDIPGAADRIICVRTDVTVRADVKALEAAAAAALGPVDVLINNGAAIDSPIALFPPSLPPASLIPCSYPLYDTGAI